MSCHDAREWLSDLVDDAVDADTRAQVDAHLTGCAECRRELDRLRATVSLLHAVERPQAPAGFADRVLEAARPVPWYRGFLDRLAAVRLLRFPVEAAAVVLVASLAVYVFQQTPALKQAASPETSADRVARGSASSATGGRVPVIAGQDAGPEETDAPARYRTPPSAPPPAHSKVLDSASELASMERAVREPPTEELGAPARQGAPPPSLDAPRERAPLSSLGAGREPVSSSRPDARREPMPSPSAAPNTPQGAAPAPGVAPTAPQGAAPTPGVAASAPHGVARTPGDATSEADRRGQTEIWIQSARRDNPSARDGAGEPSTGRLARVPEDSIPPPELRDRALRGKAAEQSAPPIQLPAPLAPAAHVVGRLTVKDRQAAHRDLAELLSRLGGAEIARRADAAGETVDMVVPRAVYPAFTQGLARIGVWVPESAPPELPDRVPITLRLAQ